MHKPAQTHAHTATRTNNDKHIHRHAPTHGLCFCPCPIVCTQPTKKPFISHSSTNPNKPRPPHTNTNTRTHAAGCHEPRNPFPKHRTEAENRTPAAETIPYARRMSSLRRARKPYEIPNRNSSVKYASAWRPGCLFLLYICCY